MHTYNTHTYTQHTHTHTTHLLSTATKTQSEMAAATLLLLAGTQELWGRSSFVSKVPSLEGKLLWWVYTDTWHCLIVSVFSVQFVQQY